MSKKSFQRSPTTFFLKGRRIPFSIAAMSMLMLFLLSFIGGGGHILAKTLHPLQPALLRASTGNASTRSTDLISLQTSARPTIRLKPTSGFVRTSTTVVGDHFAQRVVISVLWNKLLVAKTKTDKKGHFVLSFHVPLSALPGFNLVKAISANKKQSASAKFLVRVSQPSASLYPNHGLPGARIVIKGKNFTRNGRIIILFIDPNASVSSVGIIVGRINASASGTISTRFTVPHTFKKKHTYSLQVLDIKGAHSLSFKFTVK